MMKLAKTGLVAIVAAGIAVGGGVLPAQAKPNIPRNTEYIDVYYSNAQHTIIVGEYTTVYPAGCTDYVAYGTRTSYYSVETIVCG
jgi:hypothetical protein